MFQLCARNCHTELIIALLSDGGKETQISMNICTVLTCCPLLMQPPVCEFAHLGLIELLVPIQIPQVQFELMYLF